MPAPQIEDIDAPPLEPSRHAVPAGFGPIPPAWLPRRPLGGTYDEHWRDHVWPNWPADFDFAYNNSAYPSIVYPGYLSGSETLHLHGLSATNTRQHIRLPGHAMAVGILQDALLFKRMNLDTVVFDIADPDANEHRVFITWRATFDQLNAERLILMPCNPI